jgi:hypothetical protein
VLGQACHLNVLSATRTFDERQEAWIPRRRFHFHPKDPSFFVQSRLLPCQTFSRKYAQVNKTWHWTPAFEFSSSSVAAELDQWLEKYLVFCYQSSNTDMGEGNMVLIN